MTEQQSLAKLVFLMSLWRNIHIMELNKKSDTCRTPNIITFKYRNRLFCRHYKVGTTDSWIGSGLCLNCPVNNHMPESNWGNGLCTLNDYTRKVYFQFCK